MIDRLSIFAPEARNSRILAAAAGLGVAVGVAVAVVDYIVVDYMLEPVLHLPLAAKVVAPMVGLIISAVVLRTLGQGASPSTSEEYIYAFHSRHPVLGLRALWARMLAGMTTIGSGGALGLEGPSIYLGSAMGLQLQKRFERVLGRDAPRILLTAGAAAGVSALFQTPATGVIFALESPYRDDIAHRALLPSLIASAASYLTFASMPFLEFGTDWGFVGNGFRVGGGELAGAVAIGVGAGVGGRMFAFATRKAKAARKSYSPWTTTLTSGAILGGLVLLSHRLFDDALSLGPGFSVVKWLQNDQMLWAIVALFFIRAVATLVTIGGGGAGGLFIPLAVQGLLMGTVVGRGLGYAGWGDAGTAMWPVLGLAAFLGAGYRTPIAAVMFVAESSAGDAVVPALIAAAVSQLVAGASSVSAAQRVERLGHLEERVSLPLASALTTDVLTVPPDATVSEFVWVHALGRRQRVVPVVDGSKYLGLCSLDDASAIDRELWEESTIESVMRPELPVAGPSWTLRDAVAAMDKADSEVIAVADEGGTFIGVVYESEIVKLGQILDETEKR